MKYMLHGRPWYVTGKIFHFKRWMENFRESNPITFLRVWVQIPQISIELNMLTTITKPIGDLLKLRDPCIKSLNGMAIRVLMEVDVRLPLKRVFIVNGDKELPTFLSYDGLFKVCSYCGRRTVMRMQCQCVKCQLIYDEQGFRRSEPTLCNLDNNLIVYFGQPPRAVIDGAHFRMGADDSERTISWASRKRRREHEGDSENDSEGKGEVKGPSASDGIGANNG
ncbi:hypothetical protein D8674_037605 [Pyrus ussuriensis x Pyrus communis]|uniref:Uncharacterized protein n=1 Tax=Pyrus ussuriensis x Pyrus communis TaxID=2448454 RepID=A0A5N5HKG4_9ROSA|nr:hypothetical protein D8674_037605 [Pyrus ussuriensis x Pyrus communis]